MYPMDTYKFCVRYFYVRRVLCGLHPQIHLSRIVGWAKSRDSSVGITLGYGLDEGSRV
jgi:hypothetical protein